MFLFKTALMLLGVFRRVRLGREKHVIASACPSVRMYQRGFHRTFFIFVERRSRKFCLTTTKYFGARQQSEGNQLLH
jgi:hypothetical protein